MAWDDDLRGAHREIANSVAPRIGVLAGPGTGKTRFGLMRRVARLLETRAAGPHEILLLAFTRTAAQDLIGKLAELGSPGAEEVAATTVHGFCLRMLRRDSVLAATSRQPRMLMEYERDVMLRDLNGAFGNIYERRRRLRAMEAGWARQQTEHPGAPTDPLDRSFEAQILRWLRNHEAMLIGEVVPLAFEYLRTNPEADERSKFKHVIVDEYQDLNPLEQALIELLVGEDASICVAGDDDQSIYRFRFANPEGILGFLADDRTEDVLILDCRRCPDNLVGLANELIAVAPGRTKLPMIPAAGRNGSIDIVQWADSEAEIEGISAAIAGDIADERHVPGDFLVLVNRRRIGYRLRSALAAQGVEAHSFFQDNALKESRAAQEAFTLLTILAQPHDRVSKRVWLGFGDRDARAAAYRALSEVGSQDGLSPFDLLGEAASGHRHVPWRAMVDRWRLLTGRLENLAALSLSEVIDTLFPEGEGDLDLLRELAVLLMPTASTVSELHESMLRAVTQPEVPQSPDYVRIMSLHKSKGLTSPVVAIVLALDGAIPTLPADAPETEIELGRQEGRRLFYVAITRASEELVISYPEWMRVADARSLRIGLRGVRRRGGEFEGRCLPTPYLRELGRDQPNPVRGQDWLQARAS